MFDLHCRRVSDAESLQGCLMHVRMQLLQRGCKVPRKRSPFPQPDKQRQTYRYTCSKFATCKHAACTRKVKEEAPAGSRLCICKRGLRARCGTAQSVRQKLCGPRKHTIALQVNYVRIDRIDRIDRIVWMVCSCPPMNIEHLTKKTCGRDSRLYTHLL